MFCSSASMMPLPVTPKRSAHASVTWRKPSTTLAPGSPSVASRRRLAARASGSIAMGNSTFRDCARHWLDHGLPEEHCRVGSVLVFPGGPVPVFSGLDEAYAIGQMLLKRAENLDRGGFKPSAVSIDNGLGDLPNLDMPVLREAHHQRPGPVGTDPEPLRKQAGRHTDLLPPGQRGSELCDFGFQLGHSGTSFAPSNRARRCVRWLRDHASPQ